MPKRRSRGVGELVPVVVQRGVDVDGDAHREAVDTVAATWPGTRTDRRYGAQRGAAPGRRRDVRRRRRRDLARRRLAAPLQRPLELLGRRVNVLDTGAGRRRPTGAGGPPLLFLHGWGSNWQIFLLNIAAVHGHPPLPGARPAGLRRAPRCPPSRSRSRATRGRVDAMCDALGIESVASSATRWAGSSAPSSRCRSPRASSGWCSSRPRGCRRRTARAGRSVAMARVLAAGSRTPRPSSPPSCAARGCGGRRCSGWSATPRGSRSRSRRSSCCSYGKPGFVPALEALLNYSYRERLPQIEIPVLIVWGRNDMLVPVGDAESYGRLIGDNARVEVFEDTGHVPMIERPTRFNELLRGFLAGEAEPEADVAGVSGGAPSRRSRRATPTRGHARQRPRLSPRDRALRGAATSCAYFASTPSRVRPAAATRTRPRRARDLVVGELDVHAAARRRRS